MRNIKLAVVVLLLTVVAASAWPPLVGSAGQADRIKDLEEKAARQPGNAGLQVELGVAYFRQARLGDADAADKAVAVLERQVSATPADVSSARWLALSHFVKVACLSDSRAGAPEMVAALERTLTAFDLVLQRVPDDAIALAAHGSALTFMARYKRSLDLLTKGKEEMNRAVAANPTDINPKLLRALSLLNLPPQFRALPVITDDFNAILKGLGPGYNDRAQAVLHVLLGDAYIEAKETALAKGEYEAGAKLQQPAAEIARARLTALEHGEPGAEAIQKYREAAVQCVACHNR